MLLVFPSPSSMTWCIDISTFRDSAVGKSGHCVWSETEVRGGFSHCLSSLQLTPQGLALLTNLPPRPVEAEAVKEASSDGTLLSAYRHRPSLGSLPNA